MYRQAQLSNGITDSFLRLWSIHNPEKEPPFTSHDDMHAVIDAIERGIAPWECFKVKFDGERPVNPPGWMDDEFDVWYRSPREIVHQLLANPELAPGFSYAPYQEFQNEERRWSDVMSGNWAWRHAVSLCDLLRFVDKFVYLQDRIATDEETRDNCEGAMFCPIIMGSDKTTVSVATGQNDYYPLYMSIGNVSNKIRRAHKNALVVIGFLAVPKGT